VKQGRKATGLMQIAGLPGKKGDLAFFFLKQFRRDIEIDIGNEMEFPQGINTWPPEGLIPVLWRLPARWQFAHGDESQD
jgi:hypothetical protein